MNQNNAWSDDLICFIKECEKQTQLNLDSQSPNIELITQGLSNNNYLLKTSSSNFVIRENSPQSNEMCNRDSEVSCWQAAARNHLAPNLIWLKSDKSFYLSEYIPQPAKKVITAENALILLNHLKKLPTPKLEITSEQQWQIYHNKLNQIFIDLETAIGYESKYKTELTQWKQLFKILDSKQISIKSWVNDINAATSRLQFSHRDLNSENLLLKDERLICIDFEYACAAEPLYDITSLIESNQFSGLNQQALIEKYFYNLELASSDAIKAYPSMQKVYWSFFYYWAAIMAGETLKQLIRTDTPKLKSAFDNFIQYFRDCKDKI